MKQRFFMRIKELLSALDLLKKCVLLTMKFKFIV